MAAPVNIREMTAFRLVVLFTSFFVALLVASVVAVALPLLPGIPERTALLAASAVQCVVAFCIPAWICARFSSASPVAWLCLDVVPPLKAFAGVVLVYFLALPAMNGLIEWNASLHLPEFMSGIESTLREWEEANGGVAEKILEAKGIWPLLSGVAVVGILTGFSEELFFRGALQGVFSRSHISAGAAVWGAAVVFSALHFQFFGFLPRLLMGAFFGYLLVWSRSLWLPAFAHALNNSLVVATYSLGSDAAEGSGIDSFGLPAAGEFPWAAIASAVATGLLLWRFRAPLFKQRN